MDFSVCFIIFSLFFTTSHLWNINIFYISIFSCVLNSFSGPAIHVCTTDSKSSGDSYYTTYCTSTGCYLFLVENTQTHTVRVSQKHSKLHLKSVFNSLWRCNVSVSWLYSQNNTSSVPQRVKNQILTACKCNLIAETVGFKDTDLMEATSLGYMSENLTLLCSIANL